MFLMYKLSLQALPIFLDRLMDPISAVIVSVTVVLLFGEPDHSVPNFS